MYNNSNRADDECFEILIQAWYLDDGALTGSRPAVQRDLYLIEEMGPSLGLHVKLAKCVLFNTSFPPDVKRSTRIS